MNVRGHLRPAVGAQANPFPWPARWLRARPVHGATGSVLIIVLWVAFGLVSLALYFAHAMSLELRTADNRVAAIEAEQTIAGAARYVTNILSRLEEPGVLPELDTYRSDAVTLGEATFWLIGRSDRQTALDVPTFGLADEAAKLPLNRATRAMLETLPRMTPELAAAILDWRDTNEEVTDGGGAESTTYQRLTPAYQCKNTNFESVAELRLVSGAYLDLLFGEDANLNGVLDANENDGDLAMPSDNRDGRLDPGLFEYLTVYSRQPTTGTNVNNPQQLAELLTSKFTAERANQVLAAIGQGAGTVLEFYVRSGLTREEFIQIEGSLIGTNALGLVNVNTASEAVLACIPGIGTTNAPSLVAYRQANAGSLNTVAWVTEVMSSAAALQAAPWLIGRTYQFSADVAAVGRHGRGYRRVRLIVDSSAGTLAIVQRQDLTHLGWALGRQVRETLLLAKEIR